MIAGVALIGGISSFLASSFISPTKAEQDEVQDRGAELRVDITALMEEVRAIRGLLENSVSPGSTDPGGRCRQRGGVRPRRC